MIKRSLWLNCIEKAWSNRSIVWLSGVRRVGKTTLTRMLPDAVYMSCDLPSTLRALDDPELFLDSQTPGSVLILDEAHRLDDPSRLLKIAADEYPHLKVLATGSSTGRTSHAARWILLFAVVATAWMQSNARSIPTN
ncbi:MAG: AAA family ATPase [Mariprofundus sp.]